MALNAEQTFSLDLSLFGGKVSDIAPANLPAGVSPSNLNMFFYAQSTATRPAFIHALSEAVEGAVMSHIPYTPPGGIFGIVSLDSEMNIWETDVETGDNTNLFTLSPWLGSNQRYFNGSQLFDKLFLAFFDPINGLNQFSTAADIPRYINALGHCNRVTIECGGGLSITSENLENLFEGYTINTGFTRSGNIVTATLTLSGSGGTYPPNPLPLAGWFLQMFDSGAAIPTYNVTHYWNQNPDNQNNSAAIQSATPGGATAGNIIWIYYTDELTAGDPADNYDTTLYNAWQAALNGGYTMYVQIQNPAFGPAGIFPVVLVGGTPTNGEAAEFILIPPQGTSYIGRSFYYFGYQVPGNPDFNGNVAIPYGTSATYSFTTESATPTGVAGSLNSGGCYTGNELYQLIGAVPSSIPNTGITIVSDGSGTSRITTAQPITNLPIGAWLYLLLPVGQEFPFATGWVQVTSVITSTEFTISTPGAQQFSISNIQLYEYWGSLNTSVNLNQPVPGVALGTSFAQSGAQGFQITSVKELGDNQIQIQWYQLGPDSINEADGGRYGLTPQSAESPGNRQAFAYFLSEDDGASPGSPPINFTTLGGPNFTKITWPLGPSPTVSRALAVTPANGADFFTIPPANVQSAAAPIITPGTIIYDNETTSSYVDWSDAALTAAIPVSGTTALGSTYGDLTSTINLPPCLGVLAYEEALSWIGEWNNIKNFVNMSFQGGVSEFSAGDPTGAPLGWDQTDAYHSITPDQTETVAIASDGSGWVCTWPNTSSNNNGLISQTAYQDYWGAPILQPNQSYMLVCRAAISGASTSGQMNVVLFSPTQGVLASAAILGTNLSSTLSWLSVDFSAAMPSNIPSDARLLIYRSGNYSNTFYMADIFVINANTPVLTNQIRLSYPTNPFGYDNENGYTAVTTVADPIVAQFQQRKYLYALTTKDLLQTFDTGQVPSEWGLDIFALNCGGCGPNAVDSQDDIAWWIGQHGAQSFEGAKPKKISQEIEPDIDTINWAYGNIIDVATDPMQRVVYFTAPVGTNTLSDTIFTMNHRMVDPSVNIMDPVHISSYTGKLIATDLARKWSLWPVPCNSLSMAYILNQSGKLSQAMTFGLGKTGPTSYDATGSGSGSTTAVSVSVNPGATADVVFAVTNQFEIPAPSGWTNLAPLYLIQNQSGEVTFSGTGGGVGTNNWGAGIFSFATNGTVSKIQQTSESAGFLEAGTYNFTFGSNVTAGNTIVVALGANAMPSSGSYAVSDSQGNQYTIVQQQPSFSGEYYGWMFAFALNVKGGATTVTVTTPYNIGNGELTAFEFSHISGAKAFGQIYTQDFINYLPGNPSATEWNVTDADYGEFASSYQTYFFFAHDVEQNVMLALYRKLFCYMSTHVIGSGNLTITPYIDALSSAWPALPALTMSTTDPGIDYEWGLNVTGNRMSLGFSCSAGAFWLTHLIVSARRDLVFPVGGVL